MCQINKKLIGQIVQVVCYLAHLSFFLIISPFYRWLYMYKERGLEKGLYFSISYVTGHKHKILKTHSAMKGLSNSKHFTKLKQKWPDGVSANRAHILVSSQSLYLSNIFGYDKSCVKCMESNYYSSNLKMFGGKSLYVLHDFFNENYVRYGILYFLHRICL